MQVWGFACVHVVTHSLLQLGLRPVLAIYLLVMATVYSVLHLISHGLVYQSVSIYRMYDT